MIISGIGQGTTPYIAMHALSHRVDDFPKEDIVIRKNLRAVTARQAERNCFKFGTSSTFILFSIFGRGWNIVLKKAICCSLFLGILFH